MSKTTTPEQYEKLANLLATKGDIACGYYKRPKEEVQAFWDEVARTLNAKIDAAWKKSESICHKCNEVITHRIITALGKTWHPEHFACKDCDLPIKEATFNIQDGEPICSKCFMQNYSGTCHACKNPILERTIKALGLTWHEECFCCGGPCNKPLVGSSFYERDGKAYCKTDFEKLFAARCAGCAKPITENAIVALDAKWHRDCFKCKKCMNPIAASTFAVEENKPVCTDCSA